MDESVGNFSMHLRTKIEFGKDVVKQHLAKLLKEFNASKVLLTYGKSSIKKSGLYDVVIKILKEEKIAYFELSGIKPNPELRTAKKGIELVKKHSIDFILCCGGGSTIDLSKAISRGANSEIPIWEHYSRFNKSLTDETVTPVALNKEKVLPIGAILTLAATASENNNGTVLTNEITKQKLFCSHPFTRPVFALLDPTLTFTVSKHQTIAGSFDILSHLLEAYFSDKSPFVIERMGLGLMKTIIKYAPIAIANPDNYEARSNIMLTASMALNGLVNSAKGTTSFYNHKMEHEVSALFPDFSHGIGLSVLTPHVTRIQLKSNPKLMTFKLCNFGREVFDMNIQKEEDSIETANKVIDRFVEWQKKNGFPTQFSECLKEFDEKSAVLCTDKVIKHYKPEKTGWENFNRDIILGIYKSAI